MVLKTLSERIKRVRMKFEKAKAKAYGMTVPELRQHLVKRKAEKRKFKAELRQKEQEEKAKFKKWEIEQKYKRKREQAKSGKGSGLGSLLETLGGSGKPQRDFDFLGGKSQRDRDPLGIFGPAKPRKKRRKKR